MSLAPERVSECQAHCCESVLQLQQQQRIRLVDVRKGQLRSRTFILDRTVCRRHAAGLESRPRRLSPRGCTPVRTTTYPSLHPGRAGSAGCWPWPGDSGSDWSSLLLCRRPLLCPSGPPGRAGARNTGRPSSRVTDGTEQELDGQSTLLAY